MFRSIQGKGICSRHWCLPSFARNLVEVLGASQQEGLQFVGEREEDQGICLGGNKRDGGEHDGSVMTIFFFLGDKSGTMISDHLGKCMS